MLLSCLSFEAAWPLHAVIAIQYTDELARSRARRYRERAAVAPSLATLHDYKLVIANRTLTKAIDSTSSRPVVPQAAVHPLLLLLQPADRPDPPHPPAALCLTPSSPPSPSSANPLQHLQRIRFRYHFRPRCYCCTDCCSRARDPLLLRERGRRRRRGSWVEGRYLLVSPVWLKKSHHQLSPP